MRSKKPDFSAYVSKERESLRRDVARFLLWARDKHPNVFISYGEVCQRVHGYARSPGLRSKEVEAIRNVSASVRRILMTEHNCGLQTDAALGMRATTDDKDLLTTQMVKVAKRLRNTQQMFTATADLIDVNKIENTPENRPHIEWYRKSVAPVVKAITTTDFTAKLLPPKRDNQ